MLFIRKYYFEILILLITFFSVDQWNPIQIGHTFVIWLFDLLTICHIIKYKHKYFKPSNKRDYYIVSAYLIWFLFCVVRGLFVPENYWEWKQLILGSLSLSLPLFIYIFTNPNIVRKTLNFWLKYAIPAFFIFFIWVLGKDAYHFYLGPIFILICYFPILPKKWVFLCISLALLMVFSDFGARSQVLKTIAALLIGTSLLFYKYINNRVLQLSYWSCYIIPVVLLFLGYSGTFNIFQDMAQNEGKYVEIKIVNGEIRAEDLSVDTRTFIFEEVATSAVRHNYLIWGRTPARGNDSAIFGNGSKTGKRERHSNEVCHPNVFTWLGIIGLLLYSFIYFQSSYLAFFKSRSIYMKLLGLFIAFRWAFGWIEDFNRFDIANISLWILIAMGFSKQFRQMDNLRFKRWLYNTLSLKK